ncbi:MAG: hypothetical protein KDI82_05390, partial [Gammaproteobacteria bacterium]|nr:hypothetical protein [Gammaproteobacteria bacterium]
GPSGSEDRADEPDLQHATLGILAQAAIRLLHGLSAQEPASNGWNSRIGRKESDFRDRNQTSAR